MYTTLHFYCIYLSSTHIQRQTYLTLQLQYIFYYMSHTDTHTTAHILGEQYQEDLLLLSKRPKTGVC